MTRSPSQVTLTDFDFRALLTHRILVLSNTLGKGAARTYAERYGISLAEWRLLAALMFSGPGSVNGLARELAVDKGWVSRSARGLAKKRLIATVVDPGDARRVLLQPTSSGRALYKKILPAAIDRQNRLVSALDESERRTLDELLARLQRQAEVLINGSIGSRCDPILQKQSDRVGSRRKGKMVAVSAE